MATETKPRKIYEDIRPEWLNVARRLQAAVARSHNQGLAVVRVVILVNAEGKPINWCEPEMKLLEPKSQQQAILDLLSQ